jgi:endonuclease/exonuclease/phosphatase family metal-dependent hydrolase
VLAGRATGGANATHRGDPAEDTGDFGPRVGNLRLDYVLPSIGLRADAGGVFWPAPGSPEAELAAASDHRAVWIDLSFSGN